MAIETAPVQKASFRGLSIASGNPALDLVNTINYRGANDPQDQLQSYANLVEWAVLAGLINKAEATHIDGATNKAAILSEVLRIRENLWVAFNRELVADSDYLKAIYELENDIASLRPKVSIDPQTGVLSRKIVITSPHDLTARLIEAATYLFANRAMLRIKTCDGCDCDWLFIDKTKAGRRRWCDTKTCGNLARVRAYRKKH